MEESQEEGSRPESPAEAAHKTPLRRFRLGRFVLMLLFAAAAAACVAPALTSLVVAIDTAGDPAVSLKRMTEGGPILSGLMVTHGTFLLITVVGVVIVVAAAVAAALFVGNAIHPSAWTALAVVGVVGAAGTLVALLRHTEEIRLYLVFVLVAYAALTTAGLFEVWRARWVRRQWASSGASAASSAVSAPTA